MTDNLRDLGGPVVKKYGMWPFDCQVLGSNPNITPPKDDLVREPLNVSNFLHR